MKVNTPPPKSGGYAELKDLAFKAAIEEETKKEREFMSMTAHQLFTPLSMIRGFASMLYDETLGKLNPGQKDAVSEIYFNTKRIVHLVDELLSIARIQSGRIKVEPKKTNIANLIKNCVDQFNKTLPKKGVKLTFTPPEALKPAFLDEDKIRQVLYNLIDNALKYSERGEVRVSLEQTADSTIVKVRDQGIGLKDEDHEKLFQPFFRGKNILELDNQGTGLGLYISRLIVEMHHGKIWSENNPPAGGAGPDKGATFGFILPNK